MPPTRCQKHRNDVVLTGSCSVLQAVIARGLNIASIRGVRDFNETLCDGRSALFDAVTHNQVTNVSYLLDHGANINVQDDNGNTPLRFALVTSNIVVARLLLVRGALALGPRPTTLQVLCRDENVASARLLLEYHPTIVDASDFGGHTALMSACAAGSEAFANLLLEYHANVNILNQDAVSALMFLCRKPESALTWRITNLLLKHGADPSTGLIPAIASGNHSLVWRLCKAGADPNQTTTDGRSVLRLACAGDSELIVTVLLNFGALWGENSGLRDAIQNGNEAIVKLLLDRGCRVYPFEALVLATQGAFVGIMRLLVRAGADDEPVRSSVTPAQYRLLQKVVRETPVPPRRSWPRPLRFACANPDCDQTEPKAQRTFFKCGHCRLTRYCSEPCSQAHWQAHKGIGK